MSQQLFKIGFQNDGKIYEIYAREVASSEIWGFIALRELVFDLDGGMVVDPVEERLRGEFASTRVLHLPIASVLRIEEVEKKGQAVIRDATGGDRIVTPFPMPPRSR